MADFIIRVLKWLAALVTAYFILFLGLFLIIAILGVAFQPAPKVVEADSVLVLDLGFNLTDKPRDEDPGEILRAAIEGDLLHSISLRKALDGLKTAQNDPDISGLLLKGNVISDGYGGSFAALRELRQAIQAFASKKPVWAYLNTDSLRDIYIKSVATEIFSNPYGGLDFRGLRAERLYLGDAFERLGIGLQVVAFEEYKSAAESFQRGEMSDIEREQLGELIDDIWTVIAGDIAESRGLELKAINNLVSSELLLFGPEIPASGLADEQMSSDEFIDYLSGKSAYDKKRESFRQFAFTDYIRNTQSALPDLDLIMGSGNKVAVIYAEGILVDGEGVQGMLGVEPLIRYLREVRKDESVRAVVLRVNSPGGSATASFKLVREIELTNDKKPVVASMGGIATSAGYMISAPCEHIYASPSTITGSIGVVTMLPNIEGLAEKLSVNFEGVETHPFAGTYSLGRAKTEEEMRQVRALSKGFYTDFLNVVANGREMSVEDVRSRAKGRVWSGAQAIDLGLIDDLGGLTTAVQRAADLAGIGDDFTVIERPRALTLEEKITELLMESGMAKAVAPKPGTLQSLWRDVETEVQNLSNLNDPYGQYAILPYSLKIH
ncbi:signal peptide peptidase SppA [Puniceicoccales bacterium CK1056]|uniref:Signal peptide peptidase SppA n=1 Tax=Oceanipulchritudo coccoides TaxID=2706888 RepID=A0A6B2LZ03_9BACT|nr:signal peptide peptidase SppA [Oceanipulchritudo coccoides]NDV61286.1 signal peptide peptidase SppA [Oceanipulchritudo coccoides]